MAQDPRPVTGPMTGGERARHHRLGSQHHSHGTAAPRFRPPVDLQIVRESLELALQAPTGGDFQGWRWIVVTDPAVKKGVRDLYLDAHEKASGGRKPAEVVASG